MNDRLKFRYFNKFSNRMTEPTTWQNVTNIYECLQQQVCFDEDIDYLPYDHVGDGLLFMQCTGLKDKNGKLIYEGDILALQQFKDDNVVHICFWDDETAQYLYEPIIKGDKEAPLLGIEEFAQTTEYMFEDEDDIPVIIGNIYENPELVRK